MGGWGVGRGVRGDRKLSHIVRKRLKNFKNSNNVKNVLKNVKKSIKRYKNDKQYKKISKKYQNVKEDASLYATRYLLPKVMGC